MPDDRNPTCRDCGYALRGIPSGECPECGREFNWNKRTTYRTADEPGFWVGQWQIRGRRLLSFIALVAVGQLIVAGFWSGVIPFLDWTCCGAVLVYPLWLTACVVAMLALISPRGELGLLGCLVLGCAGAFAMSLTASFPGMVASLPAGLVGGLFFKHLEMNNML
ncbi:hypothetical protein OT109_10610 [Phycisphaeraceae bacterium D3-23]